MWRVNAVAGQALRLLLRQHEELFGPEHRQVAATLEELGVIHGDLGNAAKKRELLKRALCIQEVINF